MAAFNPDSYVFINGWWWGRDNSGPYIMDATGTPRLMGWMTSTLAGELGQFNRLAGGPIAQWYSLTADGLPTGWTGPGIVYGVRCLTAGTLTGLYDASSAAGTNFYGAGFAAAANTYYPIAGSDTGVLFNVSPFFDITLGTYLVFGAPTV